LNVLRRFERLLTVAGVLLALWPGLPAHCASEQSAGASAAVAAQLADEARVNFVVANVVFALLHEFGHAAIRDFEIPLLGLEEDSADTLAAMALLPGGSGVVPGQTGVPLIDMLALAAVGNAITWKTGAEQQETAIVYWAQHSLSVRRAARIACLIYGSDPQRYAWIAEGTKMPDFRRDGCDGEYAMARRGAHWVRDDFGTAAVASPGNREIDVIYGVTRNSTQAEVRRFLQERGILQGVAAAVDEWFAFPAPLTLRARTCGAPNAFWDPETREVRLCYELLEAFWQLSGDPALEKAYAAVDAARAARQQSPGTPRSGATPPPAPPR
jgi:hypothetical protein